MKGRKIGIVGCGWLGQALAQYLMGLDYTVYGTARTAAKAQTLIQTGIQGLTFNFDNPEAWDDTLFSVDTLVLTTPHKGVDDYPALVQRIQSSSIQKVIFISSTSVYPPAELPITEHSTVKPDHPLVAIEQIIQSLPNTNIIRFAGLMGPNRHPGQFFKHGRPIPNPNGVVNFIHLDDCIQLISLAIASADFPALLNGVSPDHPKRAVFYQAAFQAVGRLAPAFDVDVPSVFKQVDSGTQLNYTYQHHDLIASLERPNIKRLTTKKQLIN